METLGNFQEYLKGLNVINMMIGLVVSRALADLSMEIINETVTPISKQFMMEGDDKKIPYLFGTEINLTKIINKFIVTLFGLLFAFVLYKWFLS